MASMEEVLMSPHEAEEKEAFQPFRQPRQSRRRRNRKKSTWEQPSPQFQGLVALGTLEETQTLGGINKDHDKRMFENMVTAIMSKEWSDELDAYFPPASTMPRSCRIFPAQQKTITCTSSY